MATGVQQKDQPPFIGSSEATEMLQWVEGARVISRRREKGQPKRQGQGLGATAWAPPIGGMTQAARGNTGSRQRNKLRGVFTLGGCAYAIAKGSGVERGKLKRGREGEKERMPLSLVWEATATHWHSTPAEGGRFWRPRRSESAHYGSLIGRDAHGAIATAVNAGCAVCAWYEIRRTTRMEVPRGIERR